MSDDDELFRKQFGDVRRITSDRVQHPPKRPSARPRQRELDEQSVIGELFSDEYEPADLGSGDELYFAREGLQRRTLRKLKRGQFSMQGEVDLHGLNVEQARAALNAFFQTVTERHARCVKVIHGKGKRSPHGQPVIKQKLDKWLRQWDQVLAYCSARPVDGGTGALYVLLKTKKT